MNNNTAHSGYGEMHQVHSHMQKDYTDHKQQPGNYRLAFSATIHCLIGCGIGEILGVIIGLLFGLEMTATMLIGIVLGFIGGLALGVLPLVRVQFTLKKALKTVIIAEGLSIAVMELFEVFTQLLIPGVMEAGLTDPLFWSGMAASLIAGFAAAFPVNLMMIKKGIRHKH